MDIQPIITAISTVGFPIVICLIMVYINETQDKRHNDEINTLKSSLENNTIAITKLIEKLDSVGK